MGCSVLSGILSLRRLALIAYMEPAVSALGLAQALVHVASFQLFVGNWARYELVAGGSVEVRHGMKVCNG